MDSERFYSHSLLRESFSKKIAHDHTMSSRASATAAASQTLFAAFRRQEAKIKQKRKGLTWAQKKQMVYEADYAGISREALAEKWGIGERTLRRCLTKEGRAKIATMSEHSSHRARIRPSSKPTLERELLAWIEKARSSKLNLSVSRVALTLAAKNIRDRLLKADSGISNAERRELLFWQSPGVVWVKRFTRRHKLESVILHGAAGDVDLTDPAIVSRVTEIKRMTVDYAVDAIYNVDEFGLFFKCLPRRSDGLRGVSSRPQVEQHDQTIWAFCARKEEAVFLAWICARAPKRRRYLAAGRES